MKTSVWTIANGTLISDVKIISGGTANTGVIVRYQNTSNYYMVTATQASILIRERVNGTTYTRATYSPGGTVMSVGSWYKIKVTAQGATISVSWNGTENVLSWTDGSALWSSGKFGLTIIASEYDQVSFDNVKVMNNVGAIAAWDDFDPWGWVLQGRSGVNGSPDTRYKFTQKERDTETGLDYFGARYYDSRIGRWMEIDPMSKEFAHVSPFCFVQNNPLNRIDPDGKQDVPKELRMALSISNDPFGRMYRAEQQGQLREQFKTEAGQITAAGLREAYSIAGAVKDATSTFGDAALLSGNPEVALTAYKVSDGAQYTQSALSGSVAAITGDPKDIAVAKGDAQTSAVSAASGPIGGQMSKLLKIKKKAESWFNAAFSALTGRVSDPIIQGNSTTNQATSDSQSGGSEKRD